MRSSYFAACYPWMWLQHLPWGRLQFGPVMIKVPLNCMGP